MNGYSDYRQVAADSANAAVSALGRCRAAPLVLLLCGSAPVVAADAGDIEALRQQLVELQARVAALEARLGDVAVVVAADPVPGGWHKAVNWSLLESGMEAHRVVEILGEPDSRKRVSKFEFWTYGDSKMSLYMGRLKKWEIPSGIEGE